MKRVLFLVLLLLGLFSCVKKIHADATTDTKTDIKQNLVTVTGKLEMELYGCCYKEKDTELCTTCEDIFVILDKKEIFNNKEYTSLKIINPYEKDFNIYDFTDKKVKISGVIKEDSVKGAVIEAVEITVSE